jgi:uncharacterized protein with HEPN domain
MDLKSEQALNDMIRMCRELYSLAGGLNTEALSNSPQPLYAACFAIIQIGEAATRVLPSVREDIAGIPWRALIGMRHRLVHSYHDVDPALILGVIENHADDLANVLTRFLEARGR